MPDTNNGPAGTVTETAEAAPDKATPLPGFAESMLGFGLPESEQGEPEQATAVETSAAEVAPESEADKPKAAPAKDEAKPDAAPTVNFDGFSDESKTFWENALKAGHATPADVERARKESLFQASWTRNHQKLAKEREAFEAEKARLKADVDLLEKIRGDDKLHAAWLKMSRGEVAPAEGEDGDLVDAKKAAEIARKAVEDREREREERTAKEQREYDAKEAALIEAGREQMRMLGVTREVMIGYVNAEQAALEGADMVTTLTPKELVDRVQRRHDRAVLEAEVAALKAQLSQRASKQVQTAKQSLPPARRTSGPPLTGMSKVLADLGVARLSDVPGLGFTDGEA